MIYFILFVLLFNDSEKCINLIYDHKIKDAYNLYVKLEKETSDEKKFLDYYFSRNASEAASYYESIYQNSSNTKIRLIAKKKLYEFFYTKGLYERAETYNTIEENDDVEKKNEKIFLQCGVFTAESNAIALKEKLKMLTKNEIKLINYRSNDRELIRVVIADFKNIAEAEKLSGIIHQKLLINSIIKTDIN
jgi:hypothetical protein